MADSGPKPTMPYWHVYTDADGVSRQERFELSQFELKGVDPSTEPQWNDKMDKSTAGVTFTVLPVGWVGQLATKTPGRNGSRSAPADGSSKPWTVPASRWGRVKS